MSHVACNYYKHQSCRGYCSVSLHYCEHRRINWRCCTFFPSCMLVLKSSFNPQWFNDEELKHECVLRQKRLNTICCSFFLENIFIKTNFLFSSGIFGAAALGNWIVSIFFCITATNNTGQNLSLYILLTYNGDVKAVPGCQHNWICSQTWFSKKISCLVADKTAWWQGGL